MKINLKIKAIMIPTIRAWLCAFFGTASFVKMIRKTNRLSTERLFSVINPAMYCSPNSTPQTAPTNGAKATASRIKTVLMIADSLNDGSFFRFTWKKISAIRIAVRITAVITQVSRETFIVEESIL
jgi:hypothetical protein